MTVQVRTKGERLTFTYGDEQIPFDRVPRPRATGRVLIKVHPDCQVVVSAPEDASTDAVLSAVSKRGRWIYERLRDFRDQQAHVMPRRYVSGEAHYYLGRQHQLKVTAAPERPQQVKLLRGKIEISVREKQPERVKQLLSQWYRDRSKEIFSERLDSLLKQALWVTDKPSIRVLTMKTQWGSCSPSGNIVLNPHLVKAPKECIDYVILHELCHIAEHNHSERFYRLMSQVMPSWERTKFRLDGMASRIVVS